MSNARNLANLLGTSTKANQVISTSGAITTTGAFTSIGIDDNADAVAMTIDSSEKVGIGTTNPHTILDLGITTSQKLGIYNNNWDHTNKNRPH